MKVLLTGANGQLGQALQINPPPGVELHSASRSQLDVSNRMQVESVVASLSPDLIINAAAYTAVDAAESDPAAAKQGNEEGPTYLANAARIVGRTRLIHVSTDFVFDGTKSSPYSTSDATNPLGVYGRTKLAGEKATISILAERGVVVRTAWVYGAKGKNFLLTMLRLMKERGKVRVVTDQTGTPTSVYSLANTLWRFALKPDLCGIHHWTDSGSASWYDFAMAISEEAQLLGLLPPTTEVSPISTLDFPTPARRPAYSVLDKRSTYAALNIATPTHWRQELRATLASLAARPSDL